MYMVDRAPPVPAVGRGTAVRTPENRSADMSSGPGPASAEAWTGGAPTISSSSYYRTLKSIFDHRPVHRDPGSVPLFSGDTVAGEWVEGAGSPSTVSPPPLPLPQSSPTPPKGSTAAADGDVLSASVRRFESAALEDEVVAARACLPRAVYTLTDFTEPVSGEGTVEVAATVLAQCIRGDTGGAGGKGSTSSVGSGVTLIVSAGVRGCGALAHATAHLLGVPYVLSNWYPDGSLGDCRVDRCRGVGGRGWIYLNGVPRHSRVAVVMDVLRSGATAARLVEGVLSTEGCTVVGVYAVAATVRWRAPREARPPAAPTEDEMGEKLSGYYHCLQASTWQTAPPPPPMARLSGSGGPPSAPQPHALGGGGRGRAGWVERRAAPPLRALFLVSVAGERTHVLTRAERAAELASLQALWGAAATLPAGGAQPRHLSSSLPMLAAEGLYAHLLAQYRPCFPLECPPARRLPVDAVAQLRRMPAAELERKRRRVAASFTGVPIVPNDAVGGYPYCFFSLTDFKPALEPSLVEDMADLAVCMASFDRCAVLVSEGDRGGGPLVHAISLRTHQPYVVASWSLPAHAPAEAVTGSRSGVIAVGFGGDRCELSLAGLAPGTRCAFVDDMLSSGGTAEAVLRCVSQLGAEAVEAVFASEKLYPRRTHGASAAAGGDAQDGRGSGARLPARKGRDRLAGLFPAMTITCLAQFVVAGGRTIEPPCRVGE